MAFFCVNTVMQSAEHEAFEQRGDHVSLKLKAELDFFLSLCLCTERENKVQFEVLL